MEYESREDWQEVNFRTMAMVAEIALSPNAPQRQGELERAIPGIKMKAMADESRKDRQKVYFDMMALLAEIALGVKDFEFRQKLKSVIYNNTLRLQARAYESREKRQEVYCDMMALLAELKIHATHEGKNAVVDMMRHVRRLKNNDTD